MKTYHSHIVKYLVLATMIVSIFGLTGCFGNNLSSSTHGEMATPYHMTYDAAVNVSPIRVYVQPNIAPAEELRGLFVPLRVTQNISQHLSISRALSRQLWQVWLAQRGFAALEYDDRLVPHRVEDALALARARGANILVGGYITHYLDGGTVGDSQVSIQMELYEVATGTLLWSMGQGGSIDKQQAIDYYLVGVQARMPADPVGLTARSLGYDMGAKVARWAMHHRQKGFGGQAF